jgi:hypothetical protein
MTQKRISIIGLRPLALAAVALLLSTAVAMAQSNSSDKGDKSKDSGSTKIHIEVVAGDKDAPVANASVYVRFSEPGGFFHKQKKIEMNLKTSQEGTVKVPEIPRGKVLIQIVAPGWKTFGKWYTFEKDEETVKIKLEKPPHWY